MTEAKTAEKLMIDNRNGIIVEGKVYSTAQFDDNFIEHHDFGEYDSAYQVNVTENDITFLYKDGSKRTAYGQF